MSTPQRTPQSTPSPPLTPQQSRREEWLAVYMKRVSPLLSILALVYLATFSIQAIWYYPDATWFQYMNGFVNLLWLLFVIDLVFRFVVTPVKRGFFKNNLIDPIAR
jgi:hypothetical protein